MAGAGFSPGARTPRPQTVGIFELFLTSPVTPPHTHKDGKPGESARSPAGHTRPCTARCPLSPWTKACSGGCSLFVKQAEAAPINAMRGTDNLLLSSPSRRKEDTVTSAGQTLGGPVLRGPGACCLPTPKLVSPCSRVGGLHEGSTLPIAVGASGLCHLPSPGVAPSLPLGSETTPSAPSVALWTEAWI